MRNLLGETQRVNGSSSPTHFSRTHSGASPGGTAIIRTLGFVFDTSPSPHLGVYSSGYVWSSLFRIMLYFKGIATFRPMPSGRGIAAWAFARASMRARMSGGKGAVFLAVMSM